MSPVELKAVESLKSLAPGDSLEHGRTYYAKILLTGLESAFGTANDIAAKLTAAGFAGVVVSAQPIDDVPDRAKFPSGSTYWARGVWGGQDKKLGGGAVPSQVKAIWLSQVAALDADKIKALPAATKATSEGTLSRDLLILGGLWLLWQNRGKLRRLF